MAFIWSSMVGTLLEIDEVSVEVTGDVVTYTFLTTGILPGLVELKTRLYAYMAPPVKNLEIISVEPVEQGPICKRYKIVAMGSTKGFLRR